MKQKSLKRLLLALLCLVVAHTGRAADDEQNYVAQIGTTKYQTLTEAIAAVPTDGTATTITLLADVKGASTVAETPDFTIPKAANVTLDLNNHTVTGSGWGSVFLSEGDFTITDGSAAKGGTITGGYAKGWNAETGKFYTADDAKTNTAIMAFSSKSLGGAVCVKAGHLTVNGGTFKGNYANQGGAIYVVDDENYTTYKALELIDIADPVSAVLSNCTITGNHSSSQGGGVGVYPYAHLTINSGTVISDNSTYSNGGGVVVARTSVVTMNDGAVVSGNKALVGGGVYATGFFTMKGGSIEGNRAEFITTKKTTTRQTIFGAGLLIGGHYDKFGKTTLESGSIKNNVFVTTTEAEMFYGAGIYASNGAPVSIYNAFVIEGNYIDDNGTTTANDIQLKDAAYVKLEDDLTHDMRIDVTYGAGLLVDLNGHAHNNHISTNAELTEVIAGKLYGKPNVDAANAICKVKILDTPETYFYLKSLGAGLALISSAVDHTLTVLNDISDLEQVNIPYGTNIIDLGGHKITASATTTEDQGTYMLKALSKAENKSTLTLKNGTLDANNVIGGLYVSAHCKATISDVHFIKSKRIGSGGAVFADSYAETDFDNCAWTNNHSDANGGAVYVGSYGTYTFNKCTFTENTSNNYGGAVYVGSYGTYTFNKCTFTENTSNNYGGAIRTNIESNITLTDCTIEGNTATDGAGGAVYFGSKNTVAINGGSYSNNHVVFEGVLEKAKTLYGGALFFTNNSTATITNAKVDGNTVSMVATGGNFNTGAIGGAIYLGSSALNPSSLTIIGGSIKDNVVKAVSVKADKITATVYGAGICAGTGSTLTINGCTISGNHYDETSAGTSVTGNGGGINAATVNITGGTISNNTARSYGGGIYATTINLENVAFSGNKATLFAGGAIYSSGKLTVKGGSFANNVAKSSGGAIVVYNNISSLDIDGTTFTGNTAAVYGGAIYAATNVVDIKNATMTGNKAVATTDDITANRSLSGGALCVTGSGRTVTLTNTNVSDNIVSGETTNDYAVTVSGGGVYVTSANTAPSTLTINGGTFSGNTLKAVAPSTKAAVAQGAGIYAGGSSIVTITDATISNNTISDECSGKSFTGYGAGIYHAGGSEITYKDAENKQFSYDPMRSACGSLTVNNTTISGNRNSGTSGGGIMMSSVVEAPSSLYLGKGTVITGNTSKTNGAGVYMSTAGNVVVDGAKIADNTSTVDSKTTVQGAGLFVSGSTEVKYLNAGNRTSFSPKRYVYCQLQMLDGEISGNGRENAGTLNGSAVRIHNYTDAVIKGGKIAGTLYKSGNNCNVTVFAGKFDTEANTNKLATSGNGQFAVSNFLSPFSTCDENTDDDKNTYKYVAKLADPIVLEDRKDYTNTKVIDGVNVSYTRDLSAKVGTIVLPFVPEANNMIKYYAFGDMSVLQDGTGVIKLDEVNTIEPNKGYIYKYQGDITSGSTASLTLSASGTTICPNTVEDNLCGDWTIKGTYTQVQKNGSSDPSLYYVKASNGVMYHAQGKTNFAPYRAWATYGGTSEAKAFRLEIDGELTGIATVDADGQLTIGLGKVYDLSGREVTAPQHGNVYVVDGKKIKY